MRAIAAAGLDHSSGLAVDETGDSKTTDADRQPHAHGNRRRAVPAAPPFRYNEYPNCKIRFGA
jgi:hypothetical protein